MRVLVRDRAVASRPPGRHLALAVASAALLAACSGGDGDTASTLSEITLLTTTTEAPLFEPEATSPAPASGDDAGAGEDTATTTTPATTDAPSTTVVDEESSVTTTSDPSSTTTEPPPASPFSIRTDGIGAAAFGASPEGVIDFVSSVLGAPSMDTGWVDPFDIGPCGGSEIRQVQWATLLLEFADVSNVAQGRQHFYAYYYGDGASPTAEPAGLRTDLGLGLGSSVADLLEAHPEVSLFSGDEFLQPNFQINDALRGTMTGLADDDVITSFVGGLPCNG